MAYDCIEIAKRIRVRRKKLGLSTAQVAERIGKTIHYYGDIERGTCGMSIETLLDLAICLEASADYILFGKPEESDTDLLNSAFHLLKRYDETTQKGALEMMKLYLTLKDGDSR